MSVVFDFRADFSPSMRSPSLFAKGASKAAVSNVLVVLSASHVATLIAGFLVANGSFVPAAAGAGTRPAGLPPSCANCVAVLARFADVVDVQRAVLVLTAFELVRCDTARS